MKAILSWHFPRTALAATYLDNLDVGLMPSTVIFAPRKKGKTEFLREDLLPIAQQRGYLTIYCSMWENRSDPLAALNIALAEAAKPRTLRQRIGRGLIDSVSGSIEIGVPNVGNVKANLAPANAGKVTQQEHALLALPALLDAAIKTSKGKVLLTLDEVQHLAKPEFHEMVAALRSCLDTRKGQVKSIFTGSSRNRLQAMFSQIKAPLFQFSQTTNFPDLGDDFVDFMSHTFYLATRRRLPVKKSREAFAKTGRTPGLYREALLVLMTAGGIDIAAAVDEVLEQTRNSSGYAEQFASMRALDREVLHAVFDKIPLYSEESLVRYARRLGLEVTARQVQGAVVRLQEEQAIFRHDTGIYEIEDPQLVEWMKSTLEADNDPENLR